MLFAVVLAACAAATPASSGPAVRSAFVPAAPTAAVVAVREGELTLEVSELI